MMTPSPSPEAMRAVDEIDAMADHINDMPTRDQMVGIIDAEFRPLREQLERAKDALHGEARENIKLRESRDMLVLAFREYPALVKDAYVDESDYDEIEEWLKRLDAALQSAKGDA